jgi:aminoglycoside phosphotransferase (APT) family kinase protein
MVILESRLRGADVLTPWQRRVDKLLNGCRRLAERMDEPKLSTIHRDFYADQVIVDRDRIHLVDLDLCCLGDPALDIGNFNGHLIFDSLKHHGRPDALTDQETALEDSFERLAGRAAAARARAYSSLTLVRHLHISTLFADRRRLIEPLLDACEDRMTLQR